VQDDAFESRSQAPEQAVRSLLAARVEAAFLAALDALDPSEEREWSEWGMSDYTEVVDGDA
jgi:hypothetical protein